MTLEPVAAPAVTKQGVERALALRRNSTTNIQPVHAPTFTKCMEQLQQGYVSAVAATDGCQVQIVDRDSYGMDVLLVRPEGSHVQEVSIYGQLKNTTTIHPDITKQRRHRSDCPTRPGREPPVVTATAGSADLLQVGMSHVDPSHNVRWLGPAPASRNNLIYV
jgi:hypothetical protein